MKKGKTILAAVALGALTYLAYLALDIHHPDQPMPVTTAYEMVAETSPQSVPALQSKPVPARRIAARKSVRVRKAAEPIVAQEAASVAEEQKPAQDIPMPVGWGGHFEKQELRGHSAGCDIDRPCSPRGRDGVLLVGASFVLKGWTPHAPEALAVGSYRERTPLLVYK